MNEHEILMSLGLYLRKSFLDASLSEEICACMNSSASEAAYVKNLADGEFIDESLRKTLVAQLPIEYAYLIKDKLEQLKPDLESHFDVQLKLQEKPQFLLYEPGGRYAPHRDIPSEQIESDARIKDRRISIVIFLNDRGGAQPYSGGELTFYALVSDPRWRDYGLPVEPEPGLLVAFRSNTLHEVRPVTSGRRYTVATWFH